MSIPIYIFDRFIVDNCYNPNNPSRYNSKNQNVLFANEIEKALPGKMFLVFCGYNGDRNKVAIEFTDFLNSEDKATLYDTYLRHVNNVPDKYIVLYNDDFIRDPANPQQGYLFDTEEAANQFIVNDNLTGATPRGVVVIP